MTDAEDRGWFGVSPVGRAAATFKRTRRLRRSAALRGMVRETTLTPSDFIYPLFVVEGERVRNPIRSMPGQFHTTEVTDIVFGQPAPALFALEPPPGVAIVSPEEYECAQDPYCSASQKPVVTPPPAEPDGPPGSTDPDAIMAAARDAHDDLPAFDVTVELWSSKYPGSAVRVLHDGAGRYRVERTFDGSPDPTSIELYGPDYRYATEQLADGTVVWRSQPLGEREPTGYPLAPPAACEGTLVHEGVKLVLDRPADQIACEGVGQHQRVWIDRETRLVVRVQEDIDDGSETTVSEVSTLELVEPPSSLFELPPGIEVSPGPTSP